jgi:hypothetical protein
MILKERLKLSVMEIKGDWTQAPLWLPGGLKNKMPKLPKMH